VTEQVIWLNIMAELLVRVQLLIVKVNSECTAYFQDTSLGLW